MENEIRRAPFSLSNLFNLLKNRFLFSPLDKRGSFMVQYATMAKVDTFVQEERLTAACVLSLVGGLTDVYSYIFRGHVFANAVTGNMVLLGLNISQGTWGACAKYLFAIVAYGCGIFAADMIHARLEGRRLLNWHQVILGLEIVLLSIVVVIPCGAADFAVNAMIAFVCALQVQTFRRVRGLPFASTMCTGNLRSGSDALFNACIGTDPNGFNKARHYFLIITLFILGACGGAVLLTHFGAWTFLLAPIGLLIVLFLLMTKRQFVFIRRRILKLRRRRRNHHQLST